MIRSRIRGPTALQPRSARLSELAWLSAGWQRPLVAGGGLTVWLSFSCVKSKSRQFLANSRGRIKKRIPQFSSGNIGCERRVQLTQLIQLERRGVLACPRGSGSDERRGHRGIERRKTLRRGYTERHGGNATFSPRRSDFPVAIDAVLVRVATIGLAGDVALLLR